MARAGTRIERAGHLFGVSSGRTGIKRVHKQLVQSQIRLKHESIRGIDEGAMRMGALLAPTIDVGSAFNGDAGAAFNGNVTHLAKAAIGLDPQYSEVAVAVISH